MMSPIRLGSEMQLGRIEAGPKGGVPLVLLHGVGMCAQAWQPQIAGLSGQVRVIALDLPGHGGLAPLAGAPSLPDYVAWTAEVIEGLGLGPVALAGHSMGALIAGGVAVERPDLVARLGLLNAVFNRSAQARAAVEARAVELARGEADREAPLARWFAQGEAPEAREKVGLWLRAVDAQGYSAAYSPFASGDACYADRFAQIACPTLVLTGALDNNSSPEMAREMAALVQNGRLMVVAGERHMVSLTAPDLVTDAMRGWLGLEERQ